MALSWQRLLLLTSLCSTSFATSSSQAESFAKGEDKELLTLIARVARQITNQGRSQRCPDGTFSIPPSNQCFKLTQEPTEWSDGWAQCAAEGMVFAQPADNIAIGIRKYLLHTYGTQYIWVSGRGDGKEQTWVRDATSVLPALLYPGAETEGQKELCLSIYAFEEAVSGNPDRPYTTYWCRDKDYSARRVLCEVPQTGCPDGTFSIPPSNKCFKLTEKSMEWSGGWAQCAAEGMVFAQPADDIAIKIRRYLFDAYGEEYIWVSGRGDGKKQTWVRDATAVPSALLYPIARTEGQTERCLSIYAFEIGLRGNPDQPYTTYWCRDEKYSSRRVLCEDV